MLFEKNRKPLKYIYIFSWEVLQFQTFGMIQMFVKKHEAVYLWGCFQLVVTQL